MAGQVVAQERRLMATATVRDRLKIRLQTHLKYVKARQRSADYETRPTQRKRSTLEVSGKEMLRMSPLGLASHLISVGLLQDIEGAPCPLLASEKCRPKGFGIESTLGRLCSPTNPEGQDIYRRTVHYRCMCCRTFVQVDYKNPLFELLGGGRTSVTDMVICYYNAVEGADQTYSRRQTGVGEDTVGRLYRQARQIMAWDAVRKQSSIVFGKKPGGATTEVEADEHVFFSWKEPGSEAASEEQGRMPIWVHKYYVWLGIWTRGNLGECHLRSMGITKSLDFGDGSPPPPLSAKVWDAAAADAFQEGSNVVLMTDGAMEYRQEKAGIVEHHWVNHSARPRENARAVDMLLNAQTGERGQGIASTNFIDSEWGRLEQHIPRAIGARTEEQRRVLEEYIRAAQWRRMVSTGSAWEQWCAAAAAWIQEQQEGQAKVLERLHPIAKSQKRMAPLAPALANDKKVEEDSLDGIVGALELGEVVLLERALGKRRRMLHQASSSQAPSLPALGPPKEQDQPCTLVQEQAPPTSWLGEAEGIEELLPGPLKNNIGHALQSVLGPQGFIQAGQISWNGWTSLKAELLLSATDRSISEESAVECAQAAVGRCIYAFLRIAADNVGEIPVVRDSIAMRRYEELGYTIGTGCVHGHNDCLADSLLQCLSAAEVLPARFNDPKKTEERALVCKLVRRYLLNHEDLSLRPVPWSGFLAENLHGPHIVLFLLQHFNDELLSRPAEVELVTHSRFDSCVQNPGTTSPISPALTRIRTGFKVDSGSAYELVITADVYNETGRGCSGFHFSPILRKP
jgi:hypothetical protein